MSEKIDVLIERIRCARIALEHAGWDTTKIHTAQKILAGEHVVKVVKQEGRS